MKGIPNYEPGRILGRGLVQPSPSTFSLRAQFVPFDKKSRKQSQIHPGDPRSASKPDRESEHFSRPEIVFEDGLNRQDIAFFLAQARFSSSFGRVPASWPSVFFEPGGCVSSPDRPRNVFGFELKAVCDSQDTDPCQAALVWFSRKLLLVPQSGLSSFQDLGDNRIISPTVRQIMEV
jgi:hypothetical protein